MAKFKISELPAANAALLTDLLYLVQSNTSKSITLNKLFSSVPGNVSIAGKVTAGIVQLPSYTTAQANVTGWANGTIIYNSSTNKFQGYAGGMWVNLH
jgi:hypothetical protein